MTDSDPKLHFFKSAKFSWEREIERKYTMSRRTYENKNSNKYATQHLRIIFFFFVNLNYCFKKIIQIWLRSIILFAEITIIFKNLRNNLNYYNKTICEEKYSCSGTNFLLHMKRKNALLQQNNNIGLRFIYSLWTLNGLILGKNWTAFSALSNERQCSWSLTNFLTL